MHLGKTLMHRAGREGCFPEHTGGCRVVVPLKASLASVRVPRSFPSPLLQSLPPTASPFPAALPVSASRAHGSSWVSEGSHPVWDRIPATPPTPPTPRSGTWAHPQGTLPQLLCRANSGPGWPGGPGPARGHSSSLPSQTQVYAEGVGREHAHRCGHSYAACGPRYPVTGTEGEGTQRGPSPKTHLPVTNT